MLSRYLALMSKLPGRIRTALTQPPQKTARMTVALARKAGDRRRDTTNPTFADGAETPGPLLRYVEAPPIELLRAHAVALAGVTGHYLEHRFDLLGSGWVQVRHGMTCAGLEGHRYPAGPAVEPDPSGAWLIGRVTTANLAESRRIWRLVDADYRPIDWQLDFKSGSRWDALTWYRDIWYGTTPGQDVKVPWELARMQHLPQLALAAALARDGAPGFADPERYASEFRNQVLDFIATNPPRFGIDWTTSMDIAIRVANWLVARDLFLAIGTTFDDDFELILRRSVLEHARHVSTHLEWEPELRANHYLSDIVGLVFASAYLPRTRETDAWLAFAIQELIVEVGIQFNDDGSNFEASTCYHRLAAELATFATALVLGLGDDKLSALSDYDATALRSRPPLLPAPTPLSPLPDGRSTPLPDLFIKRLGLMAEFTADLAKPDGHVVQVGDHDSGRFLRFVPVVTPITVAVAKQRFGNLSAYGDLPDRATYWVEDHLDHRSLLGASDGLAVRPDPGVAVGDPLVETAVVAGLARHARVVVRRDGVPTAAESVRVGDDDVLVEIDSWLGTRSAGQRRTEHVEIVGGGALDDLRRIAYPDFGAFVLRSRRLFVAIRCGPVGQHGNGGHAHNDQLSIELMIDGVDIKRDPGTYLYMPLPERRNAYRSVRAHAIPPFDGPEPAELRGGLFRLGPGSEATCEYWGAAGFAGRWRMAGSRVLVLRVNLEDDLLRIDYGIDGARFLEPTERPAIPFSPGYGIVDGAIGV